MITEITSETTTWLGYLQRGSVLLQVGFFVAAISSESRLKRKLNSPLIASLNHLIVPATLFASATVLTAVGVTAGYLQYLSLLWMIWRCVEPTKQLILNRFPKVPVEEIDKSFFRPILLYCKYAYLLAPSILTALVTIFDPWVSWESGQVGI